MGAQVRLRPSTEEKPSTAYGGMGLRGEGGLRTSLRVLPSSVKGGRKEKGAEPESSQQSACAVAWSLGTGEQRSSEFWAGDRGLLADKEVLSVTFVIIPAITVEVHAVLISVVVGFSFFPKAEIDRGVVHP